MKEQMERRWLAVCERSPRAGRLYGFSLVAGALLVVFSIFDCRAYPLSQPRGENHSSPAVAVAVEVVADDFARSAAPNKLTMLAVQGRNKLVTLEDD